MQKEIESLKSLQELIKEDLNVLETSNLKLANPDQYNSFRARYNSLLKSIENYQIEREAAIDITITPQESFGFSAAWAKISAGFDFYMNFEGGKERVAEYQAQKIRLNIENITSKVTRLNYLEVQKELDEVLKIYGESVSTALVAQSIKELITRFNYQVYKYKIEDLIHDTNADIESFIPFVMEDIHAILEDDDNGVALCVKEKLQVYLLNSDLIRSNFNKVVMLINLGFTQDEFAEKTIDDELNQSLFKESDLEKEFIPITAELRGTLDKIIFKAKARLSQWEKTYNYIFRHAEGDMLRILIADISYGDDKPFLRYCIKTEHRNYFEQIIDLLIKNNFTDVKYLTESIIAGNLPNKIEEVLKLKDAFETRGKDYSYDIDCAVLAHAAEIEPQEMLEYIMATGSELLRRYVAKSNNVEYTTLKYLRYLNDAGKRELYGYISVLVPNPKVRFIDPEVQKTRTIPRGTMPTMKIDKPSEEPKVRIIDDKKSKAITIVDEESKIRVITETESYEEALQKGQITHFVVEVLKDDPSRCKVSIILQDKMGKQTIPYKRTRKFDSQFINEILPSIYTQVCGGLPTDEQKKATSIAFTSVDGLRKLSFGNLSPEQMELIQNMQSHVEQTLFPNKKTSMTKYDNSANVTTMDQFMEMLQNLGNTEDVLVAIYEYFRDFVKYNYDELQVVKFNRSYETEQLETIKDLLFENKMNTSEAFKEMLLRRLDEAFLAIEGRGLTEKNRQEWFKNFGVVRHHEATPARTGLFYIPARDAYDEVVHIEAKDYPPIYENGLLKEGCCADYEKWIKGICDRLGIPCLKVRGKGTTGHTWNLIYIKEKDIWVNFDMTMVRFYLDGWTKEYGEPEKWIFASPEEMFNMQPIRVVEEILNPDGTQLFSGAITIENKEELNKLLQSIPNVGKPRK